MSEPPENPRLAALLRRWEAGPTPRLANELAEEYRTAGQVEEGVAVLEAAVENQPGRLAPQVVLGRYLAQIGSREPAIDRLEKVVEADPTHLVANKLLVKLFLDGGQTKQARDRLDLYSLLNASDPEIEALEQRFDEPLATAVSLPPQPGENASSEVQSTQEGQEAQATSLTETEHGAVGPPEPGLGDPRDAIDPALRRTEALPMDSLTAPLGQGPEVAFHRPADAFQSAPPPPDHPASGMASLLDPVDPGAHRSGPEPDLPALNLTDAELPAGEPIAVEPPAADLVGAGLEGDELYGAGELDGAGLDSTEPAEAELPPVELSSAEMPEVDWPLAESLEAEPLSAEEPGLGSEPIEIEDAPELPEPEAFASEVFPVFPEFAEPPLVEDQVSGLEPLDLEVAMPPMPELAPPTELEPSVWTDSETVGLDAPPAEPEEAPAADPEPPMRADLPSAPAVALDATSPDRDEPAPAVGPMGTESAGSPPPAPTDPFDLTSRAVEPPDLASLPRPVTRDLPAPDEPAPLATGDGVVFAAATSEPFSGGWTEGEKARLEEALAAEGVFLPGAGVAAGAALLATGAALTEPNEAASPAPPLAPEPAERAVAWDAAHDTAEESVPEQAAEAAEPGLASAAAAQVGSTVTLGRLYLRQGHLGEAEQAFRDVLARHPENPEARLGLAELEDQRRPPLTAADLLSGVDESLGSREKRVFVLENYLRRLRGGVEGRPA